MDAGDMNHISIYAGLDLGSRFVKVALWDGKSAVMLKRYDSASFYKTFARKGIKCALGLPEECVLECALCGYGAQNIYGDNSGICVNELTAHALGCITQTGESGFSLLDIGGQDFKVFRVRDSKIVDFKTNDKCAASSGRYLEHMAHALGMEVETLFSCTNDPARLSATCAVFGESELVTLLAKGVCDRRLAAGVNNALAQRLSTFLPGEGGWLFVSGGGALNSGLMYFLERLWQGELKPLRLAQQNAALGCLVRVVPNGTILLKQYLKENETYQERAFCQAHL